MFHDDKVLIQSKSYRLKEINFLIILICIIAKNIYENEKTLLKNWYEKLIQENRQSNQFKQVSQIYLISIFHYINYIILQYLRTMEKAKQLYKNCQFEESVGILKYLSSPINKKPQINKLLALNYIEINKLDLAAIYAEAIIRQHPYSLQGYILKARILLMLGKYRQAVDILENIPKCDEKNAEFYYLKAYGLTKLNSLEQAEILYQKCFSIQNYYSPITFIGRAETLMKMEKIKEAKKFLEYARKAINEQRKDKIILMTDIQRIKRCFEAFDETIQALEKVKSIGNQIKKIERIKLKIQKDFLKKINETVFLKNKEIIEAVRKKYLKLIADQFDDESKQTDDSSSIFSCCFSVSEHS